MIAALERQCGGGSADDGWRGPASDDAVAALTLDERGVIRDCDHAVEALFGYRRSEVVWRHVSMLLPQLAGIDMAQAGEPTSNLRFLCRIGGRFQALRRSGEHMACDIFLNDLRNPGMRNLRMIVRRAAPA